MIPHDMPDTVQPGMMVMMLTMPVVVHGLGLLHAVHLHRHVGAPDAAAGHRFITVDHAGDADGVQLRQRPGLIRHQLQQRRRQHIACRAHGAVQIQCFHGVPSLFVKCSPDYSRWRRRLQRPVSLVRQENFCVFLNRHSAAPVSLRALNSTDRYFSGILFSIYNKGGITLIWILTAVTIPVTI